jgi:hypothetical protein
VLGKENTMVSKQGCAGDTGGGRMNQHLPEVENRPSEVMVMRGVVFGQINNVQSPSDGNNKTRATGTCKGRSRAS